jgi:mannitol-specific phosphotransferase system IIBC component
MNPVLKYTLGRLGLLLAVLLALVPVPRVDLLIKLLVALVVSFVLSWFLLRGWRDEMSESLAGAMARRRERRERLRAALAGEDEPRPEGPAAPGRPG